MSHEPQIPPNIEVPVSIPDAEAPKVSEAEALDELKKHGLILIRQEHISGLAKIGIFTKGAGVFPVQRGKLMVTQARHAQLMEQLTEVIGTIMKSGAKPFTKLRALQIAANAQSQLARAEVDAARAMTDMEEKAQPVGKPLEEEPEPPNQAFARGKDVVLPPTVLIQTQSAHIHEKS